MLQRHASGLILLLLCLPVVACAHAPTQSTTPSPNGVTYYVAPDGADTNDGRGADAPFRTVARAFRVVAPGDTVYLRDGVYHEYLFGKDGCKTSGREGSQITLESYPGEMAVFDGSNVEPSRRNLSAPNLIYLGACDWYVLRNLVFRNAAGRAVQAGLDSNEDFPADNKRILESSDHNLFENLTIYGNQSDGIYLVGDHNVITNVTSFDNNSTLNGGESADGIKLAFGNGNTIRCSVTYQNSDDGVDIWGSSNTLVEFNRSYQNGSGANGDGNGFKLGSGAVGPVPSNSLARFNTAYLNRSNNFDDNGGQGVTILNNTSWRAGEFGFVTGNFGSNVLANNISFQDKRDSVSGEGAETSNSWNVGVTDPHFADVTAQPPDLSLSASSPAIDVGSDVGLPFTGSAPDLGAFEYARETTSPCEERAD